MDKNLKNISEQLAKIGLNTARRFLPCILLVSIVSISLFGSVSTAYAVDDPVDPDFQEGGIYNDQGAQDAQARNVISAEQQAAESGVKKATAIGSNVEALGNCNYITNLTGCLANLSYISMWLMSRVLWISGQVLDLSLKFTLNMSDLLVKIQVVDIGWTVFRDISNIFFIFVLMWISITTILGVSHEDTKKLLINIILMALLINFSLFITKAIIDVSNIFALHFYNLMTVDGTTSLSAAFMEGLKIQTLFNPTGLTAPIATALNYWNVFLVTVCGSILILVAAFVFFAAAVLFLIRSVILMFLMLLSPLAFVGIILPGTESYAHDWWHKLFHQCIFAPLYMALAYVVVRTVQTAGFQGAITFANQGTMWDAFTSPASGSMGIIVNFLLLIFMLIGCLVIAHEFGAKGADTAMHWGSGAANWAGGAVTGFAGKHLIGKPARILNEKWENWSPENKFLKPFGGTGTLGDTWRKNTVGALEHFKYGGSENAMEYHQRANKLATKENDLTIAKTVVDNAKKLRQSKTTEVPKAEAWLKTMKNPAQNTDPAKIVAAEQALLKAKDEQKKYQTAMEENIIRLSPDGAAQLNEEDYEIPELIENFTYAQMNRLMSDKDRGFSFSQKQHWNNLKHKPFYDADQQYENKLQKFFIEEKNWNEGVKKFSTKFDELKTANPNKTDDDIKRAVRAIMATSPGSGYIDPDDPNTPQPQVPSFSQSFPELYRKCRSFSLKDVELMATSALPGQKSLLLSRGVMGATRMGTIDQVRNSENLPAQLREDARYAKAFDFQLAFDNLNSIDQNLSDIEKGMERKKLASDYNYYVKKRAQLLKEEGSILRELKARKIIVAMGGKSPDEFSKLPSGLRNDPGMTEEMGPDVMIQFRGRDIGDYQPMYGRMIKNELGGTATHLEKATLAALRQGKTRTLKEMRGSGINVLNLKGEIDMVPDKNGNMVPLSIWFGDWDNPDNPYRNSKNPMT